MAFHLIPLLAIAVLSLGTVAAASWAVENFASSAAVRARARGIRRFSVGVLRVSYNMVEFVATAASGVNFQYDSMSYDDYPEYLEIGVEKYYEYTS